MLLLLVLELASSMYGCACALLACVGARGVVDSLVVLAHGLGRSGRDDGLKVSALAEYFGIGMRASRVRMARM